MVMLVDIDSAECDGGTWGRWLAAEDQHLWHADYEFRNAVQRAAGIMIGDMGQYHLFMCTECDDHPVISTYQCS